MVLRCRIIPRVGRGDVTAVARSKNSVSQPAIALVVNTQVTASVTGTAVPLIVSN